MRLKMQFRVTQFLFIVFLGLVLNTTNTFALDVFVQDSYVSSRVKYTLSNDARVGNLKIVLENPKRKDFVVAEISSLNLLNSNFEDYISQVYFNQAGKYKLKVFSGNRLLDSDEFNVSQPNFFNFLQTNSLGSSQVVNEGKASLNPDMPIGGSEDNLLADVSDDDDGDQDPPLLGIENPRFAFENLPDDFTNLEELTFRLIALDSDQNEDSAYQGTIAFEVVDDNNAILPSDYTFVEEDAGKHVFSSSIRFSNTGEQIVHVFDVDNPELEAAFAINVLVDDSQEDDEDVDNIQISLSKPSSGISNVNTIEFEGETLAGREVKIFENDSLLISLGTDGEGKFTYTSPPLPDGSYETRCDGNHDFDTDIMRVVFRNGELFNEQSFAKIRERSQIV